MSVLARKGQLQLERASLIDLAAEVEAKGNEATEYAKLMRRGINRDVVAGFGEHLLTLAKRMRAMAARPTEPEQR